MSGNDWTSIPPPAPSREVEQIAEMFAMKQEIPPPLVSEEAKTLGRDLAQMYTSVAPKEEPVRTTDIPLEIPAVSLIETNLSRSPYDYLPRVSVGIKYLPHYEGLPAMKRATEGSIGVDLYAAIDTDSINIPAGSRLMIPLGFSMQLPAGFEAQIRPRSGLASKGIICSFGTIDSDYRGEVKAILFNHTKSDFKIERGARIAQMVIQGIVPVPNLIQLDQLDQTERGEGGFGSTGTK